MLLQLSAREHPLDQEEAKWIPLITGSLAELYIEPMLHLAGDIDVMYHPNSWLSIPLGHPPPTQLPAEFHNYVKVAEIIDSPHFPGYVYLNICYLLTRRTDDGKYNIESYERLYLAYIVEEDVKLKMHGPAMFTDYSDIPGMLSIDSVPCVRCLE